MDPASEIVVQGFGNVSNLAGGILAWSDKVDPRVPKYRGALVARRRAGV